MSIVRLDRTMVSAVGVSVASIAPAFFAGALSPQIREEFGLSATQVGLTISFFFSVTALSAVLIGRVVDNLGARLGGWAASAVAATFMLGIAAFAHSPVMLAVLLGLAGISNSLGGPASTLMLTENIPEHRRGRAFGVRQASTPLASLIAGLAIPALALTLGWRSVFVMGGVVAVIVGLTIPRINDPATARTQSGVRLTPHQVRALARCAVGFSFTIAGATALATFLVDTATLRGATTAMAGLVLSLASATAVALRVLVGVWSDRSPDTAVRVMVGMLLVGAAGFGLLAISPSPWSIAVSAMVALGAGWGWTGLLFFISTRWTPGAEGSANGVLTTGGAAGGIVGPLSVGALADRTSFTVAWLVTGGLLIVSAGFVGSGIRQLRNPEAHAETSQPR